MMYDRAKKGSMIAILLAVIVVAVVFFPLLVIWAINTLFATGIEYTIATWFAVVVLEVAITRSGASRRKE